MIYFYSPLAVCVEIVPLKRPFCFLLHAVVCIVANCQVVVSIRHPGGFVSSLKRLNWPFQLEDLLAQPLLMGVIFLSKTGLSWNLLRQMISSGPAVPLWKVLYRTVHETLKKHPRLISVRHEDLSQDPVQGFKKLYQNWDTTSPQKWNMLFLNTSSSENPTKLSKNKTHSVKLDSRANLDNWKKILTSEEITRIHKMTDGVATLLLG